MGELDQGRSASRLFGGALLGRGLALACLAAIAAFNGSLHGLVLESVTYSPVFDSVSYYVSTFAQGSYFDAVVRGMLESPQLYQTVASMFIAAMTLLIAGIPAAIYERIRGLKASTPVSLGIWLAAAMLLSLPTIMQLINGDEF